MIVWDVRQKAIWCELFDNNTSRISQVAWSPKDGLQLLTGIHVYFINHSYSS